MGDVAQALSWLSVATGLGAAALWWMASAVRIPPFPAVGWGSHSGVFEPVRNALSKAATLNKWAAVVTGIAVALQAAATALPK